MGFLLFLLVLIVAAYAAVVFSAYKEVTEKNIRVELNKDNAYFLLTVPVFVFIVHIKGFFHYYKEDKEKARLLLKMGTTEISVGIAVFLEYLVHTAVVEYVYNVESSNGVKIKQSSEKVKKQVMDLSNLKRVLRNPVAYQDSVLVPAH